MAADFVFYSIVVPPHVGQVHKEFLCLVWTLLYFCKACASGLSAAKTELQLSWFTHTALVNLMFGGRKGLEGFRTRLSAIAQIMGADFDWNMD